MAKFRKIIALVLVLVMSLSLLGINALATDGTASSEEGYTCPDCGAVLDAPEDGNTWQHVDGAEAHLGDLVCANP